MLQRISESIKVLVDAGGLQGPRGEHLQYDQEVVRDPRQLQDDRKHVSEQLQEQFDKMYELVINTLSDFRKEIKTFKEEVDHKLHAKEPERVLQQRPPGLQHRGQERAQQQDRPKGGELFLDLQNFSNKFNQSLNEVTQSSLRWNRRPSAPTRSP